VPDPDRTYLPVGARRAFTSCQRIPCRTIQVGGRRRQDPQGHGALENPLQPTAVLRAQLLVLCAGDVDASDRLSDALTALTGAVAAAIPSMVSVTVGLVRDSVEISVSIWAEAEPSRPVLSSLAGPIPGAEPGALLIVRAADADAFGPPRGRTQQWLGLNAAFVELDEHLSDALLEPGASLRLALSDLQSVQRGLGALLELGYGPRTARAELARRADSAGITMAAASQALLAEIPPLGAGERP
jgi:hypothetical protein